MEEQREKYLKTLDDFYAFGLQETKQQTHNDLNNRFKLLRPDSNATLVETLLKDLWERKVVRSTTEEWNIQNGFRFIATANQSFYEQELIIEQKKEIERIITEERERREDAKRELEILKLRREKKWFCPILFGSFIGGLCGIIALCINLSEYYQKQSETKQIQHITETNKTLGKTKMVYPSNKAENDSLAEQKK